MYDTPQQPPDIEIDFEKAPQLQDRLAEVQINDGAAILSRLTSQISPNGSDDLYRLVYRKGSPRQLMTLTQGELAGLQTAISVERGKISGMVALRPVDRPMQAELLVGALHLHFYGAIRSRLDAIAGVLRQIRNQQIDAAQARFERVTETITDCVAAIPLMADDRSLRDIHLARAIRAGDECLEILLSMREEFAQAVASYQKQLRDPWAMGQFLCHPIFAVLERLVATRICTILISANYSAIHIDMHRRFSEKWIMHVEDLLAPLQRELQHIERDLEWEKQDRTQSLSYHEDLARRIAAHHAFVAELNGKLESRLGGLLASFEVLRAVSEQDEIRLYLMNGKLFVDSALSHPLPIEQA